MLVCPVGSVRVAICALRLLLRKNLARNLSNLSGVRRYVESPSGDFRVMEQEEVYNSLIAQPDTNPDAVEIDAAIQANKASPAVDLVVKRDA